jgi:hypothetical protein
VSTTVPAPVATPGTLERLRELAVGDAGRDRIARPWRLLVLACLAVAALSLLGPAQPTYDPWAWIVWGRETLHLDLVTTDGPSWKPLPWLFTTPFALFGSAAPQLWLVVARAGGLLSIAMAYRLASRLSGRVAGVIAGGALFLSQEYVRNTARGNSEGILVAVCLWAVERHLDGRRRDAFALLFAAALLRPEVWPFWGLYGLWLVLGAWRERPPWRALALLAGSGVALAVLWFAPEYLGSGDLLRAASRARQPNPDSAAYAAHPFLEVFRRAQYILTAPVYLGAVLAVLGAGLGWTRSRRASALRLALAAVATVLMVAVAAMTQAGFAGNLRYVVLPASVVCVLSGVGWADALRGLARRRGAVVAAVVAVVVVAWSAHWVRGQWDALQVSWQLVRKEATIYDDLPAVIARAGGPAAVKACGEVYTTPFDTEIMAWHLRMHADDLEVFAFAPGTIVAARGSAIGADPRFRPLAATALWVARTSCGRG